ncbi:hypothetical protein ML462_05275 [Gramella lutea]|uniref:Uncharacterized protein n=1 Tax=Christiangramia lutea TaxID=1607951 RepID=A0A9X1V4C6_9FLAO|nr:hypothetical protein [Christiangramia lutea]MCH4822578.1 hypothetical protein [Christiangramia lutea]
MKLSVIILALFHAVFLADQEPVSSKYSIQSETLCVGDNLEFGDYSIKFKKIISDSRCPKGVTCVWAGEVEVLVEFYENGKLKGNKVITGTNIEIGGNEIISEAGISLKEYFGEKNLGITKVVVSPYPGKRKISPEEYSVNLGVTRTIEND